MSTMDDICLEHPFLKAPCESQAKCFRLRKKLVQRELDAFVSSVGKLSANPNVVDLLSVAEKLKGFYTVLNQTRTEELAATRAWQLRLKHVRERPDRHTTRPLSNIASTWEAVRLDRMIVDYMLREGLHEPADKLAHACRIDQLVDSAIFEPSRIVIEALRAKNCSPALKWCAENKRRLNKLQSSLEFQLRLQEFVELARCGNKAAAINYVRAYFASSAGDPVRAPDVQQAMALLAFGPDTDCAPYKDLYAEYRWDLLIQTFKLELCRFHGLPKESVLEIALKSGLASLKHRVCGRSESINKNCPTCNEPFLQLARDLPRAQHLHSTLVCHISKKLMDENNPPMVLPNGYVYSSDALVRIAGMNNGEILCPRSGDRFVLSDLKKCFVL